MRRRVLVIDEATKERAKEIIRHAADNVYSIDDLYQIMDGNKKPPGDDSKYVMQIFNGFRVVFSFEEQYKMDQLVLCKHLSISLTDCDALPSLEAAQEIMKLFDFQTNLNQEPGSLMCHIYINEIEKAANIIEEVPVRPAKMKSSAVH